MTKSDPGTPEPDPGANQDDAVWLDLVARLEGTDSGYASDTGVAPRPATGPETGPATGGAPAGRAFRDFDPLGLAAPPPLEFPDDAAGPRDPAGPRGSAGPRDSAGPHDAAGPRDYEADEDDGAFVPEEPPSLAGSDPLTVLAWLGAVGGPIALLLSAMFWRSAPLLAVVGMVAAFAVSVVFLITKLPQEKDEHDDGAVL